MRRLLCIGDLNADITITSDERIASGSDTHGQVALAGGGSAANVAAVLQGHPVWSGTDILPFLEGTPPAAAPSIVNASDLGLS